MHTIADVVELLELGNRNTPRNWIREFGEYLSDYANPPKGEVRKFTSNDIDVLYTIKIMREQRHGSERIHAALDAGDIAAYIPPTTPQDEPPREQADNAMVTRLTATIAKFEGELAATKEERDRLLRELSEERAARLIAEIERAKLEGRLEELLATKSPSFWARLFGL